MAFRFRGAAIRLARGRSQCLVRRHGGKLRGGIGQQEGSNTLVGGGKYGDTCSVIERL